MNGNRPDHFDEWEQRAAEIGPAIRLVFPAGLLDQECLQRLIEETARPLIPTGGVLARIYAKVFPSAWVDNELLEFLKLLRDQDWAQLDWNRNWMVIPILPEAAFVYCLPGILHWIVMDCDVALEAIEGLIDYSLARVFLGQGATGRDPHLFNVEQKRVIVEVLHLLCDFSLTDNPQLQRVASDIILHLES